MESIKLILSVWITTLIFYLNGIHQIFNSIFRLFYIGSDVFLRSNDIRMTESKTHLLDRKLKIIYAVSADKMPYIVKPYFGKIIPL